MGARQGQQFPQSSHRVRALIAGCASVDHQIRTAQSAEPIRCCGKIPGKRPRFNVTVRRQGIEGREGGHRIAVDLLQQRLQDRFTVLPGKR